MMNDEDPARSAPQHAAGDESMPLSERAIHMLREKVPEDQWSRLDEAADEFRRAIRERRELVEEAGLTDPDEMRDHLALMRDSANRELAAATTPDELVACVERAARAIREAPLSSGDLPAKDGGGE